MAFDISASVGRNGRNYPDDVRLVQATLNQIHYLWGGMFAGAAPLLAEDGLVGPKTIAAIRRFQRQSFAWSDGLVEPGKDTVQKMNQILDGLVDIVVVAAAGTPDNGFNGEARDLWEGEIQAMTVADMVSEVLRRLSLDPGKKLKTLTLIDHGAPGSQGMGCGLNWDNGAPSKSLTLASIVTEAPDPAAPPALFGSAALEWPQLSGSFGPGGLVILCGCEVAQQNHTYPNNQLTGTGAPRTVNGQDLLKLLSSLLGGNVLVEGGEVLQFNSRGIEGNCIRCDSGHCVVGQGRSRNQSGPIDDFTPI